MSTQRLTILHTADFHARLTPEKAQHLREMKHAHAPCLLLDSGDALQSANVTLPLRNEHVIDLMNEAGYDAMCLGNREYFFRRSGLLRKTRAAEFIVLAANLCPRRGDMGHIGQQKVFRVGEVRVGVFGLAREMISPSSMWARFTDMVFLDPDEVAESVTAGLRQYSDVVVLLSHLGLEADRRIAAKCDVDLILGGHDHVQVTFDSERDDPPFVSHPGWGADSGALIRLEVAENKVVSANSNVVDL